MVVSVLLKIKFGHTQISVPKIGIPMLKTACINPCIFYTYHANGTCAGMCTCNQTHQMEKAETGWCILLQRSLIKFDKDIRVLQIFRNFIAKLIAFFEKVEGRQPPISCPLVTSLLRWLRALKRERDSVKGRSSHLNVFCRKGFLKDSSVYTGKHLKWSLYSTQVSCNSIKKRDSSTDVFL